ncbi:hypothetical protein J7M02_00115, partial [Candidatus Aerophobetes bacterium]|nr:hypothetical protein [Candidatus Aerophobetes bacterium]
MKWLKFLLVVSIGVVLITGASSLNWAAQTTPIKGKVISLDFKDAPLSDVLRIISVKTGINIIIGPRVKGIVNARFENIPVLRALDIILETNNCKYEIKDNIIKVKAIVSLLKEKTFSLRYALAASLKDSVSSLLSPQGSLVTSPENNL